jgi:hypothetical protein
MAEVVEAETLTRFRLVSILRNCHLQCHMLEVRPGRLFGNVGRPTFQKWSELHDHKPLSKF